MKKVEIDGQEKWIPEGFTISEYKAFCEEWDSLRSYISERLKASGKSIKLVAINRNGERKEGYYA